MDNKEVIQGIERALGSIKAADGIQSEPWRRVVMAEIDTLAASVAVFLQRETGQVWKKPDRTQNLKEAPPMRALGMVLALAAWLGWVMWEKHEKLGRRGGRNACCGAQMFLEDGYGMVFKGALGPWYSEGTRERHLNKTEAAKLLALAAASYVAEHSGAPPREMFIHGSVRFNEEEWTGFMKAAESYGTRVVGVQTVESMERPRVETVVNQHIAPGQKIRTDGFKSYAGLSKMGHRHDSTPVPAEKASEDLPWVHIAISNAKRFLLGTYHGVSHKHLQAYLDEFCYRFNRRAWEKQITMRLLTACVFASPITFAELKA